MSDEKDDKNKSLTVRDNRPGILESALANLPAEKRQKILNKAAEEALNLEIEARKKQKDSATAMNDLDDLLTRFEDVPSNKGTFTKVKGDFKTGSGRVSVEARKGFGCFVATIAFNSPVAEEVCYLREFRDNVLCNYKLGIRFIAWYYRNGPRLARMVGRHECIKLLTVKVLSLWISILKIIR
ncbi:MAG: hypothetical protein FJ126_09005 [Deltaproteobacteria bacterium]|nr:hypothetical protein [Deltaproteobacteria bacterium]